MKYLVDSKTMKQIDEAAQTEAGIPAIVLMERAALAVAEEVRKMLTDRDKRKVSVLAVCGTGNNGGDGVAAARILREWGYPVDLRIVGDTKKSSELWKKQMQIAADCRCRESGDVFFQCGGENSLSGPETGNRRKMSEYTVLIDAVFGIGLTKAVDGIYADCVHEMNLSGVPVVAVDMPSGVSADNGQIASVAVRAAKTVTFGYSKIGLQVYPGKEYAGEIIAADIGFPVCLKEKTAFPAYSYDRSDLALRPSRREYSNKGSYGRVMVVAGSRNMCGACYLSASAAFRTGAGMVKVMTVADNRIALHALLPEAIIITWDPEQMKNKLEQERMQRELEWADAIVLGPGLGLSQGAGQLVKFILENVQAPMVVDADALHHIAANPEYVGQRAEDEQFNRLYLGKDLVLTPHLKEMADLLSCEVAEIQKDIVKTARYVTNGRKFVLALKDARTVVAGAGKESIYINESGNSGMATAGSGDVLTGVIAALLAQGMSSFDAAAMGVYLHGLAGDAAAEKVGKAACMARDLLEGLSDPGLWRENDGSRRVK